MAGGSSGATDFVPVTAEGASAAVARTFFAATAPLATALCFFFAAFLPADFSLRVRIALFFVALRFEVMGIPFAAGVTSRRSYNPYLRGRQRSAA